MATRAMTSSDDWKAANLRYLAAAIACVRERLPGGSDGDLDRAREALVDAEAELPAPSTVHALAQIFELSPFERDLVLLCAGMELDPRLPARLGASEEGEALLYPTFAFALDTLPAAHLEALSPRGPLRRWHLIEVDASQGIGRAPLVIAESVLHFLTQAGGMDPRIDAVVEEVPLPPAELAPSHEPMAQRIAALWRQGVETGRFPVLLIGATGVASDLAIVAAAAGAVGRTLFVLRGGDVPTEPVERDRLARLWRRDAVLSGAALLVDIDDAAPPQAVRAATAFVERVGGLVAVRSPQPLRLGRETVSA